jgi:membrane associated rhomboid family serine protease
LALDPRATPATAAVVAATLLATVALVPGHVSSLPADAGWLFALVAAWPLPTWLTEPVALPLRALLHASPIHALLTAVALAVAGRLHERRFGSLATLVVVLVGALGSLAATELIEGQQLVGASGGALALCGALLIDLARRQASASLFGPLVAPMLLHGALDALVPGDYGLLHGVGLFVGVLLSRLSTAPSK